jgi:hypothetical protein
VGGGIVKCVGCRKGPWISHYVYSSRWGRGGRAIDNFSPQLFRNLVRLCLSQNNYPDAGHNFALLHFTILQCFTSKNFNETIFVTVYRASLLPVKNDTADLTTEN